MDKEWKLPLRILLQTLDQIINWRTNLELSQSTRVRYDMKDKGTIQTLQYWLESYYNGKKLRYGGVK